MRNPLAPQYDEHRWDRVFFWGLAAAGALLIIVRDEAVYRGWFAGVAAVLAAVFMIIYSRRAWRTTYAGRATMLAMAVTVAWTSHATLTLFWRYPGWETTQSLIYLAVAIAALYKLRALTRHTKHPDPTTDKT